MQRVYEDKVKELLEVGSRVYVLEYDSRKRTHVVKTETVETILITKHGTIFELVFGVRHKFYLSDMVFATEEEAIEMSKRLQEYDEEEPEKESQKSEPATEQ